MDQGATFTFRRQGLADCCCPSMQEMRASKELCDVTIRAESKSIYAHRLALAAGIPYFRGMFNSNMLECRMTEITLDDVDPLALEAIIDFVYTNELVITSSNVMSVLKASIYLLLDVVADACFQFLIGRISPRNVLRIRAYAEFANNTDVVDTVDRCIRGNFHQVSLSDDFVHLSFTAVRDLISRDDIFTMSEEIVFEAVMRWVKAAQVSRSVHLPELLRHVRMPLLAQEFLNTRVSNEDLVLASPKCRDLVEEVRKYHTLPMYKSVSCTFTTKERFFKEKHHLKCAKISGRGMYSVCHRGRDGLGVDYYDSINGKWRVLIEHLPRCRSDPFYVLCTEESIVLIHRTCIDTLHLETLECTSTEQEVSCCKEAGITFLEDKVYFFGGIKEFMREVCTVDLDTGRSQLRGQMIDERSSCSAELLGKHIYVTGGWSIDVDQLASAERYDTVTNQSEEIAPMHSQRSRHSSVALNGRLYICGGYVASGDSVIFTNSAEVYDPNTNQWCLITRMNRVKGYVCTVPYGMKCMAFYDAPYKCLEVETYNPEENTWTAGDSSSCHQGSCKLVAALVTNSATHFVAHSPPREPCEYANPVLDVNDDEE